MPVPRPGRTRVLPALGGGREHHRAPAAHRSRPRPRRSDLTGLTGPIGELVTRSGEFRTACAEYNVGPHRTGRTSFRHLAVGEITLDFDAMELPAQPGLPLTAYSAPPAHSRPRQVPAAGRLGRRREDARARRQPGPHRPAEVTAAAAPGR
ncbi:hypothetical protein [Streptomyces sp. NPDC058294]|uniref:MmyB family transcriptional regulator n=1 Tax=Streptomyces sp. NPDC058294 TaxID=3346430 RepID=UPI0036F15C7E